LNISLKEVDYLKDKGLLLKQIKHKISDDVYNVLCGQFAGDRGKRLQKSRRGEGERVERERAKKLKQQRSKRELL
jgi:translation initiation factor IF-2